MNQITENIACNSEYYSSIFDTNIISKQLFRVLTNIENTINYSIHKKGKKPSNNDMIPLLNLNINDIVKYFKLNFFDETISLFVEAKYRKCKTIVLTFRLESIHDIIINSREYTEYWKDKADIIYQGWPVGIRKRIPNSPSKGKDTITIVYAQDIFHFTFHSTTSKLQVNLPKKKSSRLRKKNRNSEDEEEEEVTPVGNTCVTEKWEDKSKGAFHLKLDCYGRPEMTNPRTPLIELEPYEKPYIPFVYDTSSNLFLTFPAIIGRPETHLYTSSETNINGNMCHDPNSLDLWYTLRNIKSFEFTDNNGNKKNYIQEVIAPIFNYVVKQLNHSMKLPSDHPMSLTPLDISGNHPFPTPVNCLNIPTTNDIIRCKADKLYNESVNNSNVDILKHREAILKSAETKTGGKRRTFRRKPTRSGAKTRNRIA
jgi:hypothetical protein